MPGSSPRDANHAAPQTGASVTINDDRARAVLVSSADLSGDQLEKVLNEYAAQGWQLKAITFVEVLSDCWSTPTVR